MIFREARLTDDGDSPLIFDSWLRSFKKAYFAGCLPGRLYYDSYRAAIGEIVARPSVQVLVAVTPETPDLVRGWICVQTNAARPVLHYLYVKKAYRQAGVALALLRAAGIDPQFPFFYSFHTPDFATMVRNHHWRGHHDPDFARIENHDPSRSRDQAPEPKEAR